MGVGVEWVWRWVWATVEVGKRCKPGKENTRHVSRVLIKGKDTQHMLDPTSISSIPTASDCGLHDEDNSTFFE